MQQLTVEYRLIDNICIWEQENVKRERSHSLWCTVIVCTKGISFTFQFNIQLSRADTTDKSITVMKAYWEWKNVNRARSHCLLCTLSVRTKAISLTFQLNILLKRADTTDKSITFKKAC